MLDNASAPDLGAGPYGVEHDPEGGFYITLHGTRTEKVYYIGKTAYRAARRLNEDHTSDGETYLETPAAPEPKPLKRAPKAAPKAKAAKPAKAPKAAPAPKAEPKPVARKATHSTVVFQGTREEWLNAFVAAARPVFAERGHPLPDKIRVSVGFMFRGKKNTIGQCWHEDASSDGTREIFIIPTLDDSERIADVLTHELAHTLFGPDEKHGKNFKAAVTALGLEGKATATVAGDGWRAWALPILEKLGPIPHAALDPKSGGRIKQKTYLVKAECEDCGFVFRATAKWINAADEGLTCPDTRCGGLVCVEVEEGGGE